MENSRKFSFYANRQAAPTVTTGHNPNVPIRTFDTHPVDYFPIGCTVLPLDLSEPPVRGHVIGHVAEDRLLVDWGRLVDQHDVDEVIKTDEWNVQGALRNLSRGSHPLHPPQQNGHKSMKKVGSSNRLSFWETRPPWLFGGRGPYQKQYEDIRKTGVLPNQLKYPEVYNLLLRTGMNPKMVQRLQGVVDQLNTYYMQKQPKPTAYGFGKGPAPRNLRLVPQQQQVPQPTQMQTVGQTYQPVMQPVQTGMAAAKKREAGIRDLLYQASVLDATKYGEWAESIRTAADVASALDDLWQDRQSRQASRDKLATTAWQNSIKRVLAVTNKMRNLGGEDYIQQADQIERSLVNALTYERG